MKTGPNEAFEIDSATRETLIHADPKSGEIIRPFVAAHDLRPWYHDAEEKWLIFTRQGIDIEQYAAIKQHLAHFRSSLTPKPSDWDDSQEWKGRKSGDYEWYEMQDTVDYFLEFNRPKIVWPDIAKLPRFSRDDTSALVNNTAYFTPVGDWSLLVDDPVER